MAIAKEQQTRERFVSALLNGDEEEARDIVRELSKANLHPLEISQDLFYPSLVRVGELWCEGKIRIADEHRATQISMNLMAELRESVDFQPAVHYRMAVGSVEAEEHYLGAMMVADAFRFDGWTVDFLGPNVPTKDLVEIARDGKIRLLALSISLQANLTQLNRLMDGLRGVPDPVPKVVAGGAALEGRKAWGSELGIQVVKDPAEAVKVAKELLGIDRVYLDLNVFLKALGSRIREIRKRRSWTQQELAAKARMDRTYLVAVELGKSNLTIGALMRFAEALEVPMEFLLQGPPREENRRNQNRR